MMIDDDMQLVKICTAFLLFDIEIRIQSHFTIWMSMFSCNMRHAYQNHFKRAHIVPFQLPNLIL